MKHWHTLSALFITLAAIGSAEAKWARDPDPVPVARLIENVTRYVAAHPRDPRGIYTLARLHSMAFAYGEDEKIHHVEKGAALQEVPPILSVRVEPATSPAILSDGAAAHLAESVRGYDLAARMAHSEALYWLGLGWMQETGAPWAHQVGAPWKLPDVRTMIAWDGAIAKLASTNQRDRAAARRQLEDNLGSALPALLALRPRLEKLPAAPRQHIRQLLTVAWRRQALASYERAYKLNIKSDLAAKGFGLYADRGISGEAGNGIVRLLDILPGPHHLRAQRATIMANSQKIAMKPHVVTPIIFPLADGAAATDIEALLSPGVTTNFDLAGDGLGARWPWVKPSTGILVWNPTGSGAITSGRQLFGSVTWWMLWQDGYQALAALDDNADGELTGRELHGIAVWQDGNSNGHSDPGEVASLARHDIIAIAVRPTAPDRLTNPRGIRFGNGSTRPSFDWTPHSIPSP